MVNKEEVRRLVKIAEKDKDFAEKIIAAMKAKNADEAIRLAAGKGVTLTADDFALDGKRELDQEELEHVAGGKLGDSCEDVVSAFMCGFYAALELWS